MCSWLYSFNNETWRIVSIESDGAIKIMREASIGSQVWDTNGSNNWARPASLNTYLNETYLNGLTSITQSQIVSKDWGIGFVTYENDDLADQINDENNKKWNGKIALITASEYIRSNSNKSNCGTFSLNYDNRNSCKNTTWIYSPSINWWLLSPNADNYNNAFVMNMSGYVDNGNLTYGYHVRPVVYLSSEVQITGGNGSQSNPYTIK